MILTKYYMTFQLDFDLVPHNRLIYKIKEGYGLSEYLTNWIKDFLARVWRRTSKKIYRSEFNARFKSWKDRILEITARANRILGSLKKAFVNRDFYLWRNIYISLFRPQFEYVVQVWSQRRWTSSYLKRFK